MAIYLPDFGLEGEGIISINFLKVSVLVGVILLIKHPGNDLRCESSENEASRVISSQINLASFKGDAGQLEVFFLLFFLYLMDG